MSQAARRRPETELPLVLRIPPWQPALLILVATILLALVVYGSFSPGALLMMAVIAAAALVGAGFALRMSLIADEDGIWVRRMFRDRLVPWGEIETVQMAAVRANSVTVRINRYSGSRVDVPQALVLPTLPTNIRRVRSRVSAVAGQLNELAARARA